MFQCTEIRCLKGFETKHNWCRVRETRRQENYSFPNNFAHVEVCDILENNILKEEIAIVKSANRNSGNNLSNRKRQIPTRCDQKQQRHV